MGQIKVRQLEEWIIGVHSTMAELEGKSLEQYLRDMLKDSALYGQRQFAEEQAAELENFADKYGVVRDSTEGIREDRSTHL